MGKKGAKRSGGKKREEKRRSGITMKKSLIVRIKEMPTYWKNITVIILVGILVGVFGTLVAGSYVGITLMFFSISIPLSVYTYMEKKKIDDIEGHFPDFLRDLAEYYSSGLSLTQAVLQASKTDYGALTPEIKKISAEISWGIPFEKALQRFSDRMPSKFIKKAITILITAEEQGGEINAVLETLAEDLRGIKELEEERRGKLSIYTVTIYVIFLLLLMIAVMLTYTLAPAIPKIQSAGQFFGSGSGGLTEEEFRTLLFHISLIEAFFAGLISGQMGEGSVFSGLKHSIILVAITLLAFSLVPVQGPVEKIANTIVEIPPVEGVKGTTMSYVSKFTKDFTAADIADKVREIAKIKDMDAYKTFKPDQVKFTRTICTPCEEGKITIKEDAVLVNEPASLKYKVYYSEGKYVVEFSDAV